MMFINESVLNVISMGYQNTEEWFGEGNKLRMVICDRLYAFLANRWLQDFVHVDCVDFNPPQT